VAQSYLYASSHLAGDAAELATPWKEANASLSQSFLFQPVALETLGSIVPSLSDFLCEVRRRLLVPVIVRRCPVLQLCPYL